MQTVLFSCMAIVVMLMWVTGLWLRLMEMLVGRDASQVGPVQVVATVPRTAADLDASLTPSDSLLPPSRHPVG